MLGKYASYFQGNLILPIPEISDALDPRIISFVVVDIKTRIFADLKKDTFEELMCTEGIPGQYFCRRSFATWDVLLPTKELGARLAESRVTTKFFRFQPEYMGTRRIRVVVCNIPANLPGEVVTSYLNAFCRVEEMAQLRSTAGAAQ